MNLTPRKSRRRPGAGRAVVLSVCAAGALTLTGCSGGGGTASADSGAKAGATNATNAGNKAGASTAAATPDKKPGAGASTGAGGGEASSAVPAASKTSAPTATGSVSADGEGDGDDCDHKMPISPDEIAVYRYTPEGGSLSLIVKYGNWGCGSPDSDGAPFETVGKETYIPMDQAADVTVTNPIVESTENQPIGVQEFLDWLEAHPNSGLVFTYHLDSSGAIDRLDEVFTP
ncbi:hypothetical protein J2X68_001025 [Streptomyces sp. 3330]|uniref:hypothetical protein n=1 Tax=Streptomyces sp. 3330 TaxID=2817755 RepID=UPI002860853F|nr:hypothetical protein [Streptomyces sp. 3330]MDR6974347.1 hypothetical protein [Streptomyces sp. 3330]